MNSRRSLMVVGTLAVVLAAACGDTSKTSLCEANGVSVTIANNHPNGSHTLVVPVSDVLAEAPIVYDIQGNNTGHGHTVSVSADNFAALQAATVVSLVSSDTGAVGNDHTHAITLSCNP